MKSILSICSLFKILDYRITAFALGKGEPWDPWIREDWFVSELLKTFHLLTCSRNSAFTKPRVLPIYYYKLTLFLELIKLTYSDTLLTWVKLYMINFTTYTLFTCLVTISVNETPMPPSLTWSYTFFFSLQPRRWFSRKKIPPNNFQFRNWNSGNQHFQAWDLTSFW